MFQAGKLGFILYSSLKLMPDFLDCVIEIVTNPSYSQPTSIHSVFDWVCVPLVCRRLLQWSPISSFLGNNVGFSGETLGVNLSLYPPSSAEFHKLKYLS